LPLITHLENQKLIFDKSNEPAFIITKYYLFLSKYFSPRIINYLPGL